MPKQSSKKQTMPAQHQNRQPGREYKMRPKPHAVNENQRGSGKIALITGGDSGIGRAVAVAFAREGAAVAINYLEEHKDARETLQLVEKYGGYGALFPGDISEEQFCQILAAETVREFGALDILINNAAWQQPQNDLRQISAKQLEQTFRTNVFSMFYLCKAVLPHLKKGSVIINTASVTAYRGSHHLLDYSATKGAIVSFTRSLSQNLADKGIRVNAVAPGPIWTPLIVSTFSKEEVKKFGQDVPLGRPGQPEEVAPCYVFLASNDSSYMTGQVLHPNGGEIING